MIADGILAIDEEVILGKRLGIRKWLEKYTENCRSEDCSFQTCQSRFHVPPRQVGDSLLLDRVSLLGLE